MNITDNEMLVMKIMLKKGNPMSPSEIGKASKKSVDDATTWACKVLKKLIEKKCIARKEVKVEGTKRKRVEYRLLKKGEKIVSS